MASTTALLTAEDFARIADKDDRPKDLVRGVVVMMNVPSPRHGEICFKVAKLVGDFVQQHDVGRIVINDAGVITHRDPDTVRGADVAYYSYQRVGKGPLPAGYLAVAPEVVFEILSPSDVWKDVMAKVGDYLDGGVTIVCILDPASQQVHVYHASHPATIISAEDELALPGVLDNLRIKVCDFFA